jgi:hypothetical protein
VKYWRWRPAAWAVFLILAAIRPGIDLADRWLAAGCWNVPSEWNAVADVAMRTGVVEARIGDAPAPWRQASVLPVGDSRVGVVTVSDLHRSRSTFLTEEYAVLGALTRSTSDPALVTDEVRGYKPLSHIWPLARQDGRLQTLIAFAPLRSDPPMLGLFAYVALGAQENEVLFVCRLGSAPGPLWGELVRIDVNGDSLDDLLVYPRGHRNERPLAAFTWNPQTRGYAAAMTDEGRSIIDWWSTTPADRVIVPRDAPIDDAVRGVAARIEGGDPRPRPQ